MKLEVKGIRKKFDGTEVLHGISFDAEAGKALGLLGRNGAGKTTTIRILMDVFKATSGEVLIDGKPFVAKDYKIGYMPEERGMYPKKKVLQQLIYFGELRGISAQEAKTNAKELMKKLEIEEYTNRKLETLSKGNQQKVQLAQTLICNPDIVILDEPFSGLDPVNSQILKNLIDEQIKKGKLVIFSSHQMSYVEEFCEDIVIVNRGEIVLKGNLDAIQKDLGEKKIILNANNYTLQELETLCIDRLSKEVAIEGKKKDFLILQLLNGYSKKDFLEKLNSISVDIELFGDYKPTLTDIFVWKTGDEQ
ncbi:ABC-2 type transport system ATP-binding protein [Breznakia sp. PF5-3]|uniref:ABC transporter ATP-binding protein n=1 Tax=unclassified Breznakia TaxID=2623764 RepID=UPI002405C4AD|nr:MULTISPECIES: ATP-binding cassette domain-containing protein [unclassified Breznakia]MDF9824138.1 ABC-2 type transport system ATP-binding protein [Breznakia sp. PM6-1]MDF9834936.1 ABC-2 type transport system ATP-binding protein [Breznakia sp. PF5-3]MDF9837195.1 ABC-2 type transport system ATP-binding protein [Breznakia sp. PFB2-8]MDF9859185.1 ABC-2 type transport system ATP-binding protein [Breznakia sp. PH5-24]